MARQPEGKIKDECRKIAKQHSLPFWQIEGKAINGIPDTVAGHIDRQGVVLIEFKTGVGSLSAQQVRRIQELDDAGQRTAVCRSVDEYRCAVGLDADDL